MGRWRHSYSNGEVETVKQSWGGGDCHTVMGRWRHSYSNGEVETVKQSWGGGDCHTVMEKWRQSNSRGGHVEVETIKQS